VTNPYYNPTGAPSNHAPGSSAAIRAEFAALAAAFDKLPTFAGNAGKPVGINASSDGFVALSAFDNVAIGLVTPAAGRFTSLEATASATIAGTINAGGSVTAGGFVGPLTGNVSGNLTGNVTGNVVGNLTGNVTGNVTGNAGTANFATTAGSATSATTAATATSVNWTGVTGRPTALSQFTNDVGFVTTVGAAAAGSLTGTTLAAGVTASSLTSLGTITTLNAITAIAATSLQSQGQLLATGSTSGVATMATATAGLGSIVVQADSGAGHPAFMQFHRPGFFAAYLGLDTDNKLKWGGYSLGANAYELVHAGNVGTYAAAPGGANASGTWPINIIGGASTANTASNSGTVNNNPGRTDPTLYPILWAPNSGNVGQPTYSCDAVTIQSSTGRVYATGLVASDRIFGKGSGVGLGAITISTAAPSGGSIGDLWFRY
jgi:hypothetical protein